MKKVKTNEDSIIRIFMDDILKDKKIQRSKLNKRVEKLIKNKSITYAIYKDLLNTVKRNFGNEIL